MLSRFSFPALWQALLLLVFLQMHWVSILRLGQHWLCIGSLPLLRWAFFTRYRPSVYALVLTSGCCGLELLCVELLAIYYRRTIECVIGRVK